MSTLYTIESGDRKFRIDEHSRGIDAIFCLLLETLRCYRKGTSATICVGRGGVNNDNRVFADSIISHLA